MNENQFRMVITAAALMTFGVIIWLQVQSHRVYVRNIVRRPAGVEVSHE